MPAWAKTIMAQPIAAATNAKPMDFFMGDPPGLIGNPTRHRGHVCDAHHKESLFAGEALVRYFEVLAIC